MATSDPGPVTIRCPFCRELLAVPTEVIGQDGHQVLVRMDRSGAAEHTQECAGRAGTPAQAPGKHVAKAEPAKSPQQPLQSGSWFVAKGGSRACTMCGTNGEPCLVKLERVKSACCPACENGNTHPAPGEAQGLCSQWAEARGAQD